MTLLNLTPPTGEAATPETAARAGAAPDASAAGDTHLGQWRLARVELVNWGTFDGHHRIDIARAGHLFTGASGSGKSSLLDAIATALTPARWLRYNAAAQEQTARGADRSLVSYIRGAWAKEADENLDRAVSSYLRTGATWTGILLRYENARDTPITAVRLFHLRAGSADKDGVKDLAFVDRAEAELLDFEPFVSGGVQARRVKSAWPGATVTTGGSHKQYFAKLCRLLGIGSDGALHLLHKTQSAKNLGSLDQLFRGFMLDRPRTFERAQNAVDQFGELSQAHALVVEAREQLEHLRSLDPAIDTYERSSAEAADAQRLLEAIEPFQAMLLHRLATDERAEAVGKHARAQADARTAAADAAAADEELRIAERAADSLGGSDIERARERCEAAREAAAAAGKRWSAFAGQLAGVGVDAPGSPEEFAELAETARRALAAATGAPAGAAARADYDDHRAYADAQRELARIDAELTELRGRTSNLPRALLVARHRIAAELGVAESALPFAGELIEVRDEYAAWTGAIERVLHPIASALLVRDEYLARVRRLVDATPLGARLVYEAVPALAQAPHAARTSRSLLHRVRVSPGPLAEWLQWRLADGFDIECIDHPDEFDAAVRAVTITGQVKKSARRYEKDDRHAVDDRSRWILGTDNADKVDLLLETRVAAEAALREASARLDAAAAVRDAQVRRRTVLENVLRLDWADLDEAGARRLVADREAQLELLAQGNERLTHAFEQVDAARSKRDAARTADRAAASALDRWAERIAELDHDLGHAAAAVATSAAPSEADRIALEDRYRAVQRKLDRASLGDVGRRVAAKLHGEFTRALDQTARSRSAFEQSAHEFRRRWPAASADLDASIEDRDGYRALRDAIASRGLPQHEQNFLRLLRERSRDMIGHLLSDIRDAPKQVKARIDPVNASLGMSRFDRDRYLRIRVKEQRSGEVAQFIADLKSVVDGAWADEDVASAEARFAVLARLMRRLGSGESADVLWRQRCLDTREHVTFQAHEVDAAGTVAAVHDSSAGLSGGQRQKLVIFCLAAALRYQLAPEEDAVPAFATVMLDEAFDKADSAYTRMAMDVFVAFGFHMILATPQKLLSTIEPYVGAVTAITNTTRRRSEIVNVVFGAGDDGGGDARDQADGAGAAGPDTAVGSPARAGSEPASVPASAAGSVPASAAGSVPASAAASVPASVRADVAAETVSGADVAADVATDGATAEVARGDADAISRAHPDGAPRDSPPADSLW